MEDELTKTGSQFTHPRQRQNFPSVEPLIWCTDLMKPLCPNGPFPFPLALFYSCHLALCPAGSQRTMDHYQSRTVPAIFICMHVCLHTQKPHEYTKKMHVQMSTQTYRLSQKHSDKHKYAQRATFNQYEKQDLQNPYPRLLSHICAHKHHMYSL